MDEGRGVSGGKNLSIRSVRDLRSGHRAGARPGSMGSEGLGAPMYMDIAVGLLYLPESRGAGVEFSLPRPPRAHSFAPAPSLSQ
jgi:hypothetical protein